MRTRDQIKRDDVVRVDDDVLNADGDVIKLHDAVQPDRESADDADPESAARVTANDDDQTEDDQ